MSVIIINVLIEFGGHDEMISVNTMDGFARFIRQVIIKVSSIIIIDPTPAHS